MMTASRDLRGLRKSSGLRVQKFCWLLGVSIRALNYWERGERSMPVCYIAGFARLCEVSQDEVLKAIAETVAGSD
jgi:transcriptional regulator with XRE-family HTH domain